MMIRKHSTLISVFLGALLASGSPGHPPGVAQALPRRQRRGQATCLPGTGWPQAVLPVSDEPNFSIFCHSRIAVQVRR